MTLDLLDAAFVRRWETKPRDVVSTDDRELRQNPFRGQAADAMGTKAIVDGPIPVSPAAPADPLPVVEPPARAETLVVSEGRVVVEAPAGVQPVASAKPVGLADPGVEGTLGGPSNAGIVPRLLAAARPQWQSLADRLEAARLRGCRVIAIAGGTAGEGRSTLVDCLVAVLRARGRDVLRLGPADVAARTGRGPTHDKRIVLVDAGIWFPPGPIRRPRLLTVSQGCDAAILVRRADAAAAAAWEAALAAIGIEVLGEVLTFVPDAVDPGIDSSSSLGPL